MDSILGEIFLDSSYVQAASTSEVPVGVMKKITLQDKEILITNINGDYSAIDSVCTHFGGDLSLGILEGNVLTCPRHQAKFDVTTGRVISPPKVEPYNPKILDLKVYQVKVEDGRIAIKL